MTKRGDFLRHFFRKREGGPRGWDDVRGGANRFVGGRGGKKGESRQGKNGEFMDCAGAVLLGGAFGVAEGVFAVGGEIGAPKEEGV